MSTQSQDTKTWEKRRDYPVHEPAGGGGRRWIRAGLAVVGGALVIRGLRQRTFGGLVMALVGGWMLSRGIGGAGQITKRLTEASAGGESEMAVTARRNITIGKPAEELYEMWRDPDQLSEIMGHFAEVTAVEEDQLRWTIAGPRGRDISWETRIVEDEPGDVIRWETTDGATVPNEGTIIFQEASGGRGTQVTLSVTFDPPGGRLTNTALKTLDIAPEILAGEALGRFKSLAESGEIQTLEGNTSARGRGDLL